MSVTVKMSGFAEVEAELAKLKRATGKAVLKRAGTKAMLPMAAIAARYAPRLTGDLQSSIAVSAKATGNAAGYAEFSAVLRSGGSRASAIAALRDARRGTGMGPHAVDLFMGPAAGTKDEAIKAIVQEFGSHDVTAQPYMRPAWLADRTAMLQRIQPLLMAEIEKTVARSAARAARLARAV